MSRLPIVNFKVLEKTLMKIGFQATRQKGSHVFYKHPDGRTTTIPHHTGRDIARPLLMEIIKEIGMTTDEFCNLVKKKKK